MRKKVLVCVMMVSALFFFTLSSDSFVYAASTIDLSKAPRTIKIGVNFSITGKFAGFYKIMGDWENALVKVINDRGGIYVEEYGTRLPIKVTWYDDRSDPPTTIKLYEKLVNVDKVDLLIGPTASPMGIAGSTVAEKYKIPMVLTSSNDPKIFNRGFRWITAGIDTGIPWSRSYFTMLKERTNAKRVAVLTEDTVWPQGIRKGVLGIAEGLGFDIVYDKFAPRDTKDFTSVIGQLKRANPDVVYVPAFAPFFTTFMKQVLSQGYKPKALHGTAGVSAGFLDAVGKGANYVTGDGYWISGIKYEGYDVIAEALKLANIDVLQWQFGPPINFASHQILFKAIEHAGTLDRNKVQEALETSTFGTIGGLWKRQPNGAGTYNPFPLQNIGGELHAVYPSDVATKKFVYPMP
jgi:branched-chain amino acid transport system substrate-binding protein